MLVSTSVTRIYIGSSKVIAPGRTRWVVIGRPSAGNFCSAAAVFLFLMLILEKSRPWSVVVDSFCIGILLLWFLAGCSCRLFPALSTKSYQYMLRRVYRRVVCYSYMCTLQQKRGKYLTARRGGFGIYEDFIYGGGRMQSWYYICIVELMSWLATRTHRRPCVRE